ncbi:hypothetical protein WSM22_45760 [Cytophagales bacterium WSM2-2]|nr:hypothetical protein WSM22_45760 [Cytophagales bacterium WSM2-2]
MKTKNILITAIAALFSAAFVSGCKDDNVEKKGVCPLVVSTSPANLGINVPLTSVVTITFNEAMNPATIAPGAFTLLSPGSPGGRVEGSARINMAGTLTYDEATFTMTFTPVSKLAPNATYTGTVGTSVKDKAGNALQVNYVWTFSTSALVSPTVVSTDPLNNSIGIALNKVVAATFSVPMDPLTITSTTFNLKQGATAVSGIVSYTGSTASFTPSSPLASNTTYTGTITTGAKNVPGTPLANDFVWSFSTAVPLGPPVVNLNSVARFGIIAGVGVSNNAGPSVINNLDVGIYPGVRSSVTGFPPAVVVGGTIYASDDVAPPGTAAMLLQAQNDLTAAYNAAAGATLPAPAVAPADLGGKTLAPGIYTSASTMLLQNGNLTLDAQGDANAVWIFQVGSALTTVGSGPFPSASGGNVILAGGAQAKNVFWQVSSSATIGDFTSFKGNILSLSSITMNSGAVAEGRMLARNGSVIMTSSNIINKP